MAKPKVEEIAEHIISVKEFSLVIEEMVHSLKIEYLDALMLYAEKHNVEVETVGSLVKNSHTLKAKLAAEGEKNLLLKPTGSRKLPI